MSHKLEHVTGTLCNHRLLLSFNLRYCHINRVFGSQIAMTLGGIRQFLALSRGTISRVLIAHMPPSAALRAPGSVVETEI